MCARMGCLLPTQVYSQMKYACDVCRSLDRDCTLPLRLADQRDNADAIAEGEKPSFFSRTGEETTTSANAGCQLCDAINEWFFTLVVDLPIAE